MSQLIISIVVSCYNVENFVSECLDSLLKQDIPQNEYEIVCVNDCSSDNTKCILENYQKTFSNIKVINHETNKKVGVVRNTGRVNSNGKYVWFVDGDDLVCENSLAKLLNICESNNLDELFFNYEEFDKFTDIVHINDKFRNSDVVLTGFEFVRKYFDQRLSDISIVWHQLYRRDFLSDNNYLFPEMNMGEDGPFAWRTLLNAQRVMSISDICYYYRVNESSMTYKFNVKPDIEKLFEKSIQFAREVFSLSKEIEGIDKEIAFQIKNIAKWNANSFKSYLLEPFNCNFAYSFYLHSKSKRAILNDIYELLSSGNKSFVDSVERGVLNFSLWLIIEKLKMKVKKQFWFR